jgi:eukaryotic-like serine/threonine-protein kinase
MTPERWQQIEHLLQAALEREPAERAAQLERECAGDRSLREEVESLLASAQPAQSFLEANALEDAAELLKDADSDGSMPGRQIGPYSTKEKLGSGGTGEVYLAHDIRLGRRVALKLLDPGLIDDNISRTRFLREARLAAALDHPNICTIHEVGEAEGRPFIAMQYVEGKTLRQVIAGRSLALDSLLSISLQVADALAAAHARGIIHRDIKAGNIIVTPQGQAKVLDFGLAKLLEREEAEAESHLTMTGVVMGTPASMSPEQARGARTDHRSDIFSFGGVIYEMATGRIPFEGKSRADMISALLKDRHTPAAAVNDEIPASLSAVIDRALAKEPADRYQSMREMISDLRQVVAEAGGMDQLFSSSGVPRGGVPLVPLRQLSLLTVFGRRIPKRLAFALLTIMTMALIGLTLVIYRSWTQPAGPAAQSKAEQPGPGVPFQSIAVLPFRPLVSGSRDEALEMGMADTLINKLGGTREIIVRPISAVRKYADLGQDAVAAGREQRVDVVLDGSIQKSADKVRVTVRLIKVENGRLLWTESFDERFTDIFAVQDHVSEKVIALLAVSITGQEQKLLTKRYTDNAEAYDLYLKGRFHLNRLTDDGFLKSLEYFQQAIQKDPNFALAHAGAAESYCALGNFNVRRPKDVYPKSRSAALTALKLDELLGQAHTVLATVKLAYDWDWSGAEKEFQRSLEINPSDSDAHYQHGYYLAFIGKFEEAISEMRRAQELDPVSLVKITAMGQVLLLARRYDEGIAQCRKALEMDPNLGFAHWLLGLGYMYKGAYEQAIPELQKSIPLSAGSADEPMSLGLAYALSGKTGEARKILDEVKQQSKTKYVSPGVLAALHAALGEMDQAFALLDKAYVERDSILVVIKVEPMFDALRADPRFADLVRRVGLPQ